MAPRVNFTRIDDLFEDGSPIAKELLKNHVLKDFKQNTLIGVPDTNLQINFSPDDGDDILIHVVDPENAQGYSVYAGEKDYFNRLSQALYEPTEEDILGGLSE